MRPLIARRLARLENVFQAPDRHATLKDLLLASMGQPVPAGVVRGGPLVETILATAAIFSPSVATQWRHLGDCGGKSIGIRGLST
jgi:hypothetical protein